MSPRPLRIMEQTKVDTAFTVAMISQFVKFSQWYGLPAAKLTMSTFCRIGLEFIHTVLIMYVCCSNQKPSDGSPPSRSYYL